MKSSFTLFDFAKLVASLPATPPTQHFVLSLQAKARLENERRSQAEQPHGISSILGFPVYEMPKQKTPCLIINNRELRDKYINGEITEEEILALIEKKDK